MIIFLIFGVCLFIAYNMVTIDPADQRALAYLSVMADERNARPFIKFTQSELNCYLDATFIQIESILVNIRHYYRAIDILEKVFPYENKYLLGANLFELHEFANGRVQSQPDDRTEVMMEENKALLKRIMRMVKAFNTETYDFIKKNRIETDYISIQNAKIYSLFIILEQLDAELETRSPFIDTEKGYTKLFRNMLYKIFSGIKPEGIDHTEKRQQQIARIKNELENLGILYSEKEYEHYKNKAPLGV